MAGGFYDSIQEERAELEVQLLRAKVRKENGLALRYEIDNQRLKGQLVEIARVDSALRQYAGRVKEQVLQMPARHVDELMAALRLTDSKQRHTAESLLYRWLTEALAEVMDGGNAS